MSKWDYLLESWNPTLSEGGRLVRAILANPDFRSTNNHPHGIPLYIGEDGYYFIYETTNKVLSTWADFKAIAKEASKRGLVVERVKSFDVRSLRPVDHHTDIGQLNAELASAHIRKSLYRITKST